MILFELVDAGLLYAAIVLTAIVSIFAWTIASADRSEFYENRKRTRNFLNPFWGALNQGSDGARDPRVHAGLVFNKTTKMYETQYALSDEAVRAVLFHR